MKIERWIVLCLLLAGCASNPYQTAAQIEAWILSETPYSKDVFDCTERAVLAVAMLDEEGIESLPIMQVHQSGLKHRCVEWRKGEDHGFILCMNDPGWERV